MPQSRPKRRRKRRGAWYTPPSSSTSWSSRTVTRRGWPAPAADPCARPGVRRRPVPRRRGAAVATSGDGRADRRATSTPALDSPRDAALAGARRSVHADALAHGGTTAVRPRDRQPAVPVADGAGTTAAARAGTAAARTPTPPPSSSRSRPAGRRPTAAGSGSCCRSRSSAHATPADVRAGVERRRADMVTWSWWELHQRTSTPRCQRVRARLRRAGRHDGTDTGVHRGRSGPTWSASHLGDDLPPLATDGTLGDRAS
jgi:hypothetical protein